jgi:hypothetical protein
LDVECFRDKAAQDQATKATKTQGGSAPHKTSAPKPPTVSTPRTPSTPKGTYIASTSTLPPVNQKVDNTLKGTMLAEDKEILIHPNNPNKKLRISSNLKPK